jgi:two-component system response regulator HydG
VDFDVRVIAASHRDLETEIEAGRFREDLYYRLNVVQIHLPPLRLRGNDILLLANVFLKENAARMQRPVESISTEAAKLLLAFDWPGNVRQLQNCIERAVTLTRFAQIAPDDLPAKIQGYVAPASGDGIEVDPDHVQPLDVVERLYIERVLKVAGGNKSLTARLLGLDRRTLYRKLESYGETDASPPSEP